MNTAWTGGQYSIFRLLFGLYLLVHFLHLVPWGAEVFSSQGMLADASLSPLMHIFPNVLHWSDHPLAIQSLLLSAGMASIAFAVGWYDRLAALWMWYVLACLFTRNPLIANPALPYVGWMLLAHLLVPKAPYGSLAAHGRADPAGAWQLPRSVLTAGTVVLALSYSYSGYTKLLSPSWVDGQTLAYVLENPLARDWLLRDLFLMLPAPLLSVITWFILYVELLYAPLLLIRPLRFWLWLAMLLVQVGFLFLLNFPDLTIGMLLFHLFTFDPAWVPHRPIRGGQLFYDGECGLCHRVVRFVLAEDRDASFRFAPLHGATFMTSVPDAIRHSLPDSFVIVTPTGTVLTRSNAVVYLLQSLGGLWLIAAMLLAWLPESMRDALYNLMGRHRQKLFRKPAGSCPLMTAALRKRFAMDDISMETT